MGRRSKRKHTPDELAKAERKELLAICNQILEVATGPTPLTPAKQWEEFIEINSLVKKIQAKQLNDHLFTTNREEHLEGFTSWLKENGVSMDKVKVVDYGLEGYGLQATEDIKAEEIFLCIPRKLMITDENVKASALGPLVKSDRILSTMPHVALALFLLSEKISGNSFWQPYIDFLPREYSMPLYFTTEELQYLKGSHTFGEALKQHKNIARQYAYFYKMFQTNTTASKLPLRDRFSYNAYRWAVCAIMSRQNQIPDSIGSRLVTALIPKWDMCNHANGTITTGYSFQRETSESVAEKDFKKGEQLHIFYGSRPNAHFLLYSGFVYPENEHDTIAIQLGVSKNDRLYAMKSQILAMLRMTEPSHTFYIQKSVEPITVELWTFLRVFSMDEEQLKDLLLSSKSQELFANLMKPNCLVSKQNEMKVWSFLDVRLRLLYSQYQTSDQKEEEELKDDKVSYNAKLCIKLRRCEKQVLENAIDHIALQKLRVEDLPEEAISYTPEGVPNTPPEPPLASEEDSDITATYDSSERNSREYDFEDAPEDNGKGDQDKETREHLENGEDFAKSDSIAGSIKSDSESTLTNTSELSQVTISDDSGTSQALDLNHNPNEKSKDQLEDAEAEGKEEVTEVEAKKGVVNGSVKMSNGESMNGTSKVEE